MDKEGFVKFLEGRKLSKKQLEQHISIIEKFEDFLNKLDKPKSLVSASVLNFRAFSTLMVKKKLNTFENYLAIARYALFIRNNKVYVASISLIDGAEAIENLYDKLGKEIGKAERDEIFEGIVLPLLGTPNSIKSRITESIINRMEKNLDEITCKRILGSGLRDLEDQYYLSEKEKYGECKDIDEYLKRKGDDFIAELKQSRKDMRLYFNQEITEEVIEFVESHPEIRQGVRKGNIIYEAKIPYQAKEYIAEKDNNKKRYYYCHCPWVKESLKRGHTKIPAVFCNCSAAFHKKPYEVIFGKRLRAEVLESVVKGNLWCRFAIYLPESVAKKEKHK